jgi:hypothetical protein
MYPTDTYIWFAQTMPIEKKEVYPKLKVLQ